jgi:hypothetical protein
MITQDGINKIEQFFVNTIDKAQFVVGSTAYDALHTNIELMTDEDRLIVIATSGPTLPVGETVTQMRLLDKDGDVFAQDTVSMVRGSEADGLFYGFKIGITQQEV